MKQVKKPNNSSYLQAHLKHSPKVISNELNKFPNDFNVLTKKTHITNKVVVFLLRINYHEHIPTEEKNMALTESELKRLETAQRSFPLIDIESIVYMGMKRPQALKHLAYYENKAEELKV